MSGISISFDFGTKSIGVAVGQRITCTAQSLKAIKTQNSGTPDWLLISHLINEWKPDEVVVGLPFNIDGTEQPLTTLVRNFANEIYERFNISVKLHDERLSTFEAKLILFEHGGYRALNKEKVDSTSAVVILESFFNRKY